jgi:hypothetical protein
MKVEVCGGPFCVPIDKGIAVPRTFRRLVPSWEEMREAVAVYAARAVEKLRAEGLEGRSFNRDRCNLDRRMDFMNVWEQCLSGKQSRGTVRRLLNTLPFLSGSHP